MFCRRVVCVRRFFFTSCHFSFALSRFVLHVNVPDRMHAGLTIKCICTINITVFTVISTMLFFFFVAVIPFSNCFRSLLLAHCLCYCSNGIAFNGILLFFQIIFTTCQLLCLFILLVVLRCCCVCMFFFIPYTHSLPSFIYTFL